MKYKWIVMQELEDSNMPIPFKIVDTEERAEAICYEEEKNNPGFIFWACACACEEE